MAALSCTLRLGVGMLVAAGLWSLVGCGSSRPTVIAQCSLGPITWEELEQFRAARPRRRGALTPQQELEDLVVAKALAQVAREQGLDEEPSVRRDLVRQEEAILQQALRTRLAGSMIVEPERVEAYYRDNRQAFHKPRRPRVRNLFLQVPGDATPRERAVVRRKLESIRERVIEGEDFVALAERFSDSQTRYRGGSLGAVDPTRFREPLRGVLESLSPGEVSPVVSSSEGFTIFLCEGELPAKDLNLEEARPSIETILRRERSEATWSKLMNTLWDDAGVTIREQSLTDPDARAEAVVAKWKDGRFLRGELDFLVSELPGGRDVGNMPEEAVERLIEHAVKRRLAAARARELGLHRRGETATRLAWSHRLRLAKEEMDRRVVERVVPPTEERISAWIERHSSRLRTQPRYRLSAIRRTAKGDTLQAEYEQMDQLAQSIRAGSITFEDAARECSELDSAAEGGSLGWRTLRAVAGLGPAPFRAVRSLEVGEVSPLVQDGLGLWILRLDEVRQPRPVSEGAAETRAQRALLAEAGRAAEERLRSELLRSLELRITGPLLENE